MKRLIFDVPRWHVFLHREARGLPPVEDNDSPHLKLEDELFDRLYAGGSEVVASDDKTDWKDWAEKLHSMCGDFPAFQRLTQECLGDADASALAVEKLLESLKPHMKQSPDTVQPPTLRRAVTGACDKASAAIEAHREASDGLTGVGFGTGTHAGGRKSGSQAQRLSFRLKNDERLRRIALLAGKLKRIALAKQKAKVRHGADEVTDVELGSNVSRLLPSEMMKLAHQKLRLPLLASLTEGKAMQYRLEGKDSLGRGPLVVCLDKSGSMDGERDIWATAVALALLEVAQRQKRAFAMLAFDGVVKHEAVVTAGGQLPEDALFVACTGGTNITGVIHRALEVIEEGHGAMKKADVVLVTDGGSDFSAAPALRQRAAELGVTVLGLGIGVEAESLKHWCDEAHSVSRLDTADAAVAESVFTL